MHPPVAENRMALRPRSMEWLRNQATCILRARRPAKCGKLPFPKPCCRPRRPMAFICKAMASSRL